MMVLPPPPPPPTNGNAAHNLVSFIRYPSVGTFYWFDKIIWDMAYCCIHSTSRSLYAVRLIRWNRTMWTHRDWRWSWWCPCPQGCAWSIETRTQRFVGVLIIVIPSHNFVFSLFLKLFHNTVGRPYLQIMNMLPYAFISFQSSLQLFHIAPPSEPMPLSPHRRDLYPLVLSTILSKGDVTQVASSFDVIDAVKIEQIQRSPDGSHRLRGRNCANDMDRQNTSQQSSPMIQTSILIVNEDEKQCVLSTLPSYTSIDIDELQTATLHETLNNISQHVESRRERASATSSSKYSTIPGHNCIWDFRNNNNIK